MKKITIIILTIFLFSHAAILASAQDNLSNGAATGTEINGAVENGDIITSTPQGYKLATSPYDPQIFGVVSLKPALYFQDTTQKNEVPVISDGEVVVKVSSINGNINR